MGEQKFEIGLIGLGEMGRKSGLKYCRPWNSHCGPQPDG